LPWKLYKGEAEFKAESVPAMAKSKIMQNLKPLIELVRVMVCGWITLFGRLLVGVLQFCHDFF